MMFNDLFKQLNEETIVLTPNRRLSAHLHKLYQEYQKDNHKIVWETPRILPILSWLPQLLKSTQILLLNPIQEQYLWEDILLNANIQTQLLQISETADLARSAWGLLKQWQVDLQHPLFDMSEDYSIFHEWKNRFQELCEKEYFLDTASLPDLLIPDIEANQITLPKQIFLYGFLEYSPQLNHLLKTCESSGSKIINITAEIFNKTTQYISLLDQESEIVTIARWAKFKLQKNPQAKIGCVFLTLENIRDRVKQVFSEVFFDNESTVTSSFNISAGKSLSQYPIIKAGLQLLKISQPIITYEIFTYIFTTPFMGEAETERLQRAYSLRSLDLNNISVIHLLNLGKDDNTEPYLSLRKNCPHFIKRIKKFFSLLSAAEEKKSYTEWANQFHALLTALGWPGERSLNSEEYQVVESWLKLLTEFKSLDHVAKQPTKIYHALHMLTKMTKNQIFQPKTPEAPIQVLGILEAAAMPFDYLWIAGLDDATWPPQSKPNPFIPKSLQRELKMPHATAEREFLFCQMLMLQFQQSTRHLILSHATQNEELILQPSPLIKSFTPISLDELQLPTYYSISEKIFTAKKMEYLCDENAPALSSDEILRGGISVLKDQALCPFKSFSTWRLHAHETENPLPGLRAKDRGNLVHKLLEIIWNQLKNHETLVSLTQNELTILIEESIDQTFQLIPNFYTELKIFSSLEKIRLKKLMIDWLEIEKNRPPFKIIVNENSVPFTIGPLSLKLKIDRIDELACGKKLIIDYKTSKNNEIHHWLSDRPQDPQLPLYSLTNPGDACGITFAQVCVGEHQFKGLSHYNLEIPGIKLYSDIKKNTAMTWTEQLDQWKTVLTQLSVAFYSGDAAVNPKDALTCTRCRLNALCRVNDKVTI